MAWKNNADIEGVNGVPAQFVTNNPESYGIIFADDIQGHRTVKDLNTLYEIPTAILSKSKINIDNDAIGQLWFVISENCHYQLIDWSKRKSADGWKKFNITLDVVSGLNGIDGTTWHLGTEIIGTGNNINTNTEEFKRNLFLNYDIDVDSNITIRELEKLFLSKGLKLTQGDLDDIINLFDADGDGRINYIEFLELVNDNEFSKQFRIEFLKIGDLYLNINTFNIYQCIDVDNDNSIWKYIGCIKGPEDTSTKGKDGTKWHFGELFDKINQEDIDYDDQNILYHKDVNVGDWYLNTTTCDIWECMQVNESSSNWKYIANIKGDAGENGEKGNKWYTNIFPIDYNDKSALYSGPELLKPHGLDSIKPVNTFYQINDFCLNTEFGLVHQCVESGYGNKSKWKYIFNIRNRFHIGSDLAYGDPPEIYYNQLSDVQVDDLYFSDNDNTLWQCIGLEEDYSLWKYLNYIGNSASSIDTLNNSGSDMRFKTNIKHINKGILDKLMQLDIISYKWNKQGDPEYDTFGVNGNQLKEFGGLFAKMVNYRNDKEKTLQVEYDRFGVLAIKGLQEIERRRKSDNRKNKEIINKQQTEIENLQRENSLLIKKQKSLESRLVKLEGIIKKLM